MNKLDHVVTTNLNKNKYQSNKAINNDPMFDTDSINLSSGISDYLSVVNVSLQGGNKHRAMSVSGIK